MHLKGGGGGSALDGSEDAHQVSAQNLPHVVRRVATNQQRGGDLGQVRGRVDALGQRGDAVEVGADADVIDTRDPEDVVEVVDQRLERRAGEPRGKLAVDLVGEVVGNGLALGGVLGGEGLAGSGKSKLLSSPRLAVVLVDKGLVEVEHHGAAVGCEGAKLVGGEVAV